MKHGPSVYAPGQFERRGPLHAPRSYWVASRDYRDANCNGCGTSGWKGELIPDTVYGLSINSACQIHDWMYAEGQTDDDKNAADALFLTNLLALVAHAARATWWSWLLAPFRRRRCLKYFEAVSAFGGSAFHAAVLAEEIGVGDL